MSGRCSQRLKRFRPISCPRKILLVMSSCSDNWRWWMTRMPTLFASNGHSRRLPSKHLTVISPYASRNDINQRRCAGPACTGQTDYFTRCNLRSMALSAVSPPYRLTSCDAYNSVESDENVSRLCVAIVGQVGNDLLQCCRIEVFLVDKCGCTDAHAAPVKLRSG